MSVTAQLQSPESLWLSKSTGTPRHSGQLRLAWRPYLAHSLVSGPPAVLLLLQCAAHSASRFAVQPAEKSVSQMPLPRLGRRATAATVVGRSLVVLASRTTHLGVFQLSIKASPHHTIFCCGGRSRHLLVQMRSTASHNGTAPYIHQSTPGAGNHNGLALGEPDSSTELLFSLIHGFR